MMINETTETAHRARKSHSNNTQSFVLLDSSLVFFLMLKKSYKNEKRKNIEKNKEIFGYGAYLGVPFSSQITEHTEPIKIIINTIR